MKTTNRTSEPVHIGIIGGMGPQASALLHTMIIDACTKQLGIQECHEFPLITHVSIPAVDFISQPELRSLNTAHLQRAAQALQSAPLDIAIIACNTAHLLIDEIVELEALPLLTLPDSVLDQAKRNGVTTLGLIATPTTIRTKLYESSAQAHGIELITPSPVQLRRIERIIRSTIAGKAGDAEAYELRQIANQLKAHGAQQVALGCTELSVIMSPRPANDLIDSLTATTTAVVERMRSRSKEPSHV